MPPDIANYFTEVPEKEKFSRKIEGEEIFFFRVAVA